MVDSKVQELNKLYQDGESVDKTLYAEMRSNILLISGDHYQKKNWKLYQHIRESQNLSEEQKIRIMKNHTNKIYKTYVNRICSVAPGTKILPANEKELQDVKAAEIHSAVWTSIKKKENYRELVQQLAEDYVGLGEAWVRIAWDWTKGNLKRVESDKEEVTLEDGTVEIKETNKRHLFQGGVDIQRVFGFNIFRPKACQDLSKAEWLGYRYMESEKKLKEEHPDKEESIRADGSRVFLVFDQNSSDYAESKENVLVKEIYYRPSAKYPKGYYYKYTESVVLAEGELPEGIFPLHYCGFDSIPTHPRYNSPVKQWKPYQIEINRMASKMAEHQVTLGDDKVVIQNGGKLSSGGNAPGIRALSATGGNVTVIPGRTGEQYLSVMNNTITEYYQNAMVSEELDNTPVAGQIDPYALLMSSNKWKTRFSTHLRRFEDFLVKITEIALEVTRAYIEEDEIISIAGRHEAVNISEYKNMSPLGFQIALEPSSDDIESMLGKKMSLDRYIQYAGANMSKEDIGKFIKQDPYLNKEQIFSDFTMTYENANNDILALDRGELPIMSKYRYPDVNYVVQRLTNRMGQADFSQLPPNVQQNYAQTVQQYEQLIVQMVQEQAALNADMIPTSGPLIRTDFWVQDPNSPTKTKRLELPNSTLMWVWDRIQKQGMTTEMLQQQQQAVVSDVANQMRNNRDQMQAQSQGGGELPPYIQRFIGMVNSPGQG